MTQPGIEHAISRSQSRRFTNRVNEADGAGQVDTEAHTGLPAHGHAGEQTSRSWLGGRMDGRMDGRAGERADGRAGGRAGGRVDGWVGWLMGRG